MITNFNRVLFDYDGTILIHNKETEVQDIADVLLLDDEKTKIFEKELLYFRQNYDLFFSNNIMTYDLYYSVVERVLPCLEFFGITPLKFTEAVEYKNTLRSYVAENVIDTLEYLKDKGYKLCVLTNGFYKLQVQSMKHHKVLDYFENVYAWDNCYPKPDLRFMKKALDGTNPKSNVMVGDNLMSDIQMAKNAGVFSVLYSEKENTSLIKPDV